MSLRFVVMKSSRGTTVLKGQVGYRGLDYDNPFDAAGDALLLSINNPVGFYVLVVGEEWPTNILAYFTDGHIADIPEHLRGGLDGTRRD